MNTDEVLKAATPRPWNRSAFQKAINLAIAGKATVVRPDFDLILVAVNAYEADRALIADLGTALECCVATEHSTVSSRHESVRIARAALTKYYEHKAKERTK
jgi:hypothetical protein